MPTSFYSAPFSLLGFEHFEELLRYIDALPVMYVPSMCQVLCHKQHHGPELCTDEPLHKLW